jgi:hypothetical protein
MLTKLNAYIVLMRVWNPIQGCYVVKIWPGDLDLWPWKSIGFQTILRTKYVPGLVKIHWRMLILECSQGCYAVNILPSDIDLWSMTLKINRVPDVALVWNWYNAEQHYVVCQWLETGRWFSLGNPVSSTNKTDCHDITEILLKVVLNTINPNPYFFIVTL